MTKKIEPIMFQQAEIRRVWHKNEWYFSIIDIVKILTKSTDSKQYIKKMRRRDLELSANWSTICTPLEMTAKDGKNRKINCANIEGIFRIIQSIPSKKAEPLKQWLARVGKERIDEIRDPELAMTRMKNLYKKKGYPDGWIEKRVRGIAVRNELTDEWENRGAKQGIEYAILTNEILQGTFSMTAREYKDYKSLDKENLRDHMNDLELVLTMLAEATTTQLSRDRDSKGVPKLKKDAKEGGEVGGNARKDIEKRTHKRVSKRGNYLPK